MGYLVVLCDDVLLLPASLEEMCKIPHVKHYLQIDRDKFYFINNKGEEEKLCKGDFQLTYIRLHKGYQSYVPPKFFYSNDEER